MAGSCFLPVAGFDRARDGELVLGFAHGRMMADGDETVKEPLQRGRLSDGCRVIWVWKMRKGMTV